MDEFEDDFRDLFGDSYGSWKKDPIRSGDTTGAGVDSMLDSLSAEGETVSDQQSFTLNQAKAEEKLRDYALTDVRRSVVHLVGAAVASGSSKIAFNTTMSGFQVYFDGAPFSKSQINNLIPSLLDQNTSSAARELALALNTLRQTSPRKLLYQSWHDNKGFYLPLCPTSAPESLEMSPFPSNSMSGHLLTFQGKIENFLSTLREGCRYSSIPVLVNKKDVRAVPLSEVQCYLLWANPEHPLGELGLSSELGLKEQSPGPYTLLLAYGPAPGMVCNVNGINYAVENDIPNQGAWCLVVDNKANRDLTFQSLREQPQWSVMGPNMDIGLRKLVNFAEHRLNSSTSHEEREEWASRLRIIAPQNTKPGKSSGEIYQTSDGQWVGMELL